MIITGQYVPFDNCYVLTAFSSTEGPIDSICDTRYLEVHKCKLRLIARQCKL
jgi:hypothetical protein